MSSYHYLFFFFLNDPPTTEIYPLSLHDALPIFRQERRDLIDHQAGGHPVRVPYGSGDAGRTERPMARGSRIGVARVAVVVAPRRRAATAVRARVEIVEAVRLDHLEAVDRPAVHGVVVVEVVLGNLRRVHVIDQQPTAAGGGGVWALVPNLAVVLKHRRIGLHRLTI